MSRRFLNMVKERPLKATLYNIFMDLNQLLGHLGPEEPMINWRP